MSQVLEKPILLDETGQEIVDKLDDIKDAIGMGGEFTPVMIKVTTPPAKIAYMSGEPLDLAGIVVSLIAANGVHIDVTDQCVFSPANGTPLTNADTNVSISYHWWKDDVTFTTSLAIGVKTLASIAITTPPTQTEYYATDALDLTGIVVVATYDDSSFIDITSRCSFSPADGATLSTSDTVLTATYTEGSITKTATTPLTVIEPIYGVDWDGSSSPIFTRTDLAADFVDPVPYYPNMTDTPSSPFDDIMPWKGMTVVDDADAGKLVKIPKFWYKLDTSSGFKLQISSIAADGFSVSPAHRDRGDGVGERDYVYIGKYHCSSSDYKSVSGVIPKTNTHFSTANTAIQNLGTNIWMQDYATLVSIQMLYLVEFANWDVQRTIGYGCGTGNAAVANGQTDSIPYHTGRTTATGRNYVLYRNIENLWANIMTLVSCARFNISDSKILIKDLPTSPNVTVDSTGVVNVGGNMIKAFKSSSTSGYDWVFYPSDSTTGGSYNTYVCDVDARMGNTSTYPAYGGYYNQGYGMGLFAINAFTGEESYMGAYYSGYRLMKLPANS